MLGLAFVACACSSASGKGETGDTDAAADTANAVDVAAEVADTAAVCVAPSVCLKASLASDGSCALTPKPDGETCAGTGVCASVCNGGVCQSQSGKACGGGPGVCPSVCMGGVCISASDPACSSTQECSGWPGVPKPKGTPCGTGPCGNVGACDGFGLCKTSPVPEGAACGISTSVITPDMCELATGSCEGGVCRLTPKPAGTPCKANADSCMPADGSCDGQGVCKRIPLPFGTPCKLPKADCPGLEMACDGAGACKAVALPVETTCNFDNKMDFMTNPCLKGVCDSDAACQPVPLIGKACAGPGNGSGCFGNTCDAKGFCGGATTVLVGANCLPPGSNACVAGGQCAADGTCTPTFAVGKACETGDACHPGGKCTDSGACVGAVAIGASCPTGDACLENGKCDATGKCVGTVNVGAVCGSPPGECLVKQCQTDGSCQAVADTGASCATDMNPCKSSICASDGTCQTTVKVGAACPTGDGSCTKGVCDAAGACALTIQPGKACKMPISKASGVCLSDGICQTPCKPGEACQGACGSGTCDATGHCLTPTSAGKACAIDDYLKKKCITSCSCNGQGGVDVVGVADGTTFKASPSWGVAAICIAGSPVLPPKTADWCDDGNPCTQDQTCPGDGAFACGFGFWDGSDWQPSVDCLHSGKLDPCGGSGCHTDYCHGMVWSQQTPYCTIWNGDNDLCKTECEQKCGMPPNPCTQCGPNPDLFSVDCPCVCTPTKGNECGNGLVCKAGQCILQ